MANRGCREMQFIIRCVPLGHPFLRHQSKRAPNHCFILICMDLSLGGFGKNRAQHVAVAQMQMPVVRTAQGQGIAHARAASTARRAAPVRLALEPVGRGAEFAFLGGFFKLVQTAAEFRWPSLIWTLTLNNNDNKNLWALITGGGCYLSKTLAFAKPMLCYVQPLS